MHRAIRIGVYVTLYGIFVGLSFWFTRRKRERPRWLKLAMLITGLWLSAVLIEER